MPWGRSGNGDEPDRWSARTRWDIVWDGARRGGGKSRGLDGNVERKITRQIERKLPLGEEMADQALIGRVTPRLGGIVATIRFRRRAQIVGRAGQLVQARPAQRDQHVARQQRAEQEMSKYSKHVDLIERDPTASGLILNNSVGVVKTRHYRNSAQEPIEPWPRRQSQSSAPVPIDPSTATRRSAHFNTLDGWSFPFTPN